MFSFVGNLKLFIMELKANELRLGNYVYSKSCNCNFAKGIIEIDFEAFRKIHLFNGLSGLSAVPLTEEILLKCKGTLDGYVHSGWDDMHFFRFDEYSANIFEIEIRNDGFYYEDGKIEFLHDLQNCYYFHENRKKELTVNL